MNIQIGDYFIESDSLQFVVKEKKVVEKSDKAENNGKPYLKPIAYCCKFEEALKFIPNEVLRNNDDINIIVNKLNQIQADIQALEYKPVIVIKENKKEGNENE